MRVQDGAGLRFTVSNIPATLDYYVVVRYEPEVRQSFQSILEYQRLFVLVHFTFMYCKLYLCSPPMIGQLL